LLAEIGAPFAEIVVDVDHRNPSLFRPPSQRREVLTSGNCVPEQFGTPFELHVVDDIDEDEREAALIGDVSMKIVVPGWHGLS
jgi:hypothetical protein